MTDPSARIRRVDVLRASPGQCALCGKNEHPEGFAETDNFDFDFFGTVYFCYDCIGDYARVFGFKSPSELDDLEERFRLQRAELAMLRQAVVHLENTVDNLTGLSDLRRDYIVPGGGDGNIITPEPPADSPVIADAVEAGVSEVGEADEPSSEPRRDDVRDTTDSESIDKLLAL